MLTATSSATVSSNSATGSTSKNAASDMNAAQDRFLKLLVAQLNNQDPMNPLDNAQMTSQMAQINTVTGIQQLNETLKSMAAVQVLQGTNMIGHDVLINSSTLTINNGKAQGAVELPARAESVKVDILSPGGQVVDTLKLGPLEAGRSSFSWDASAYKHVGNPTFKITATTGGETIEATALARATVQSVSNDDNTMMVQLTGRSPVSYNSIKVIM